MLAARSRSPSPRCSSAASPAGRPPRPGSSGAQTQSARLAAGEAFLEVFNPGKLGGPTACLTVSTAEGNEEGCADVTGAFTLADDLSAASLAPTAFDLYVQVCEGKACEAVYSRTVTVEATWAAAGAGQRVHERLLGGGGAEDPCETVVVVTGLFQPATGTLVVDGTAAEGTGDLQALAEVTRRTCR